MTIVARAAVVAAIAVLSCSPAVAQQAPRPGCTAVPKQEYDTARKGRVQQNRFGEYVRTGSVLRRKYWYCTN